MPEQLSTEYVLGIDLGSNSLGWAVIGLIDGEPAQLIRAGVRVFEAGVNVDPKSGREKTLNAQRREARQQRRQIWRRRRRLVKLAHILQRAALLPEGNLSDPETRQSLFNGLDGEILGSRWFAEKVKSGLYPAPEQTMPYILRAAALDEKLEPRYLGRALYHLAQHRGFWNNKKTAPKKDEKPGEVEGDIKTLRSELGGRTLGQYFAGFSPLERRIRDSWWTARDMYQAEFKAIWQQQAKHHPPLLTEELRRKLYDAIFDQRPLKLKRTAVGQCEFEPGERRAPAHLLISQRFRLLQVVNNIRVRPFGGEDRTLTPEERAKLTSELGRRSDMTFKEVRELLGFTRRHSINLQRDKEELKLPGNDTGAQMYNVFGDGWLKFSPEVQDGIVADAQSILSVRDADKRAGRVRKYLKKRGVGSLDEACDRFLGIVFEAGYRNLSVAAMQRLVPLLEHGFQYGAISPHYRYIGEVTGELIRLAEAGVPHDRACEHMLTRKPAPATPLDLLPPVLSEEVQRRVGAIRNPIVTRSLTELRKVVNAVVGKFGKPTRIHIELLRELRKPQKVRERIWKENLARGKRSQTIEENIKEINPRIDRVTPKDIEKYRLWQESETCPYCLKTMTQRLLFGDDSEYQIDHIVPFSRSLDDSFANKVLCHTDCNRSKGQMTPFEKFGRDLARREHYEEILECVSHFKGDFRDEKLRRFKMADQALEEFLAKRPAQQFNDSAYASRLAADFLSLLYGGRVDSNGNLCVQARSGGLTKYFREAWNLNSILGDGESKNGGKVLKPRHDHRHHAIDAAVIAATDQDMVRRLNDAAKRRQLGDPGRFGDFSAPPRWPRFRNELKNEVTRETPERVQVSHRVSKKVSGALHEETIYSRPMGEKGEVRVRKPLAALTRQEVEKIADEGVRKLVQEKLEGLGGVEPKKAFSNLENLPRFPSSGVVIKSARIAKPEEPTVLGQGRARRHVISGNNHHIEIYAELDRKGNEKQWGGEVVPMMDAYQRLKAGKTIVQRDFGPLVEFKFSLAKGDTVELQEEDGQKSLWVVRKIGSQVSLIPINDARRIEKYFSPRINGLFKRHARKVVVSPIGEVSEAHD